MRSSICVLAAATMVPLTQTQSPPEASGLTLLSSNVNPEVTISFKEVQICDQDPDVKSYSGYVSMPGSLLSDVGGYDQNIFFLYFEARNNASTAPLGIYLAGGPGESYVYAALSSESGPCYVNVEGTDMTENPWSFNNHVNMLYVDQPVGTGFSYGSLINGTFDLLASQLITPIESYDSPPLAAKSLWHIAEHWLSSFPGYDTESNRISIWGNSYGGYWAPETAAQFANALENLSSEHPLESYGLRVDAIGITNGCVDIQSAMLGYPAFAYNNTYGVQYASETEFDNALQNYTMPNGCYDLIEACRATGDELDPEFSGSDASVNELCMQAFGFCAQFVINAFPELNEHSAFDIAENSPAPCDFYLPVSWYLNNATTQQALGVRLNFTQVSNVVAQNFGLPSPFFGVLPLNASTGDGVRQKGLPKIEYLLANDVKVAFIFGDCDYRCPCTGGQATALAANWTGQNGFCGSFMRSRSAVVYPDGR